MTKPPPLPTTMLMPPPLLQIEGLSVMLGGESLVDGLDFSIEAGAIFGLAGVSGSGKTMTALSLMGLVPPSARTSGRMRFSGRDVSLESIQSLRGESIGMVFQEPMTALNPLMRAVDQVAEMFIIHRGMSRSASRKRAISVLERVGLEGGLSRRYPHELSGGQRQRVMLASAIALEPRLLIADEPTTALDSTTQAEVLAVLKGLVVERGMSMLLITHDLAVLADMAGGLAVMEQGRIVEMGATDTVLRRPKHQATRALLEAVQYQPHLVKSRAEPPAEPPGEPLLSVDNVSVAYGVGGGRHYAVEGVSFALHQGESLGLVGRSGCGKSSLARAILGLEAWAGGAVVLHGAAASESISGSVMQIVFQDPYGSFNPRHKVRRLLSEPFHRHAVRPKSKGGGAVLADAVAEVLEAVGLSADAMERYSHEFSGGQRQRLAIARAIITKPRLVILDEAVSALDVLMRRQILDLLLALKEQYHLSYLLISHDLNVVRMMTERVLVMEGGRLVEAGKTADILENPQHSVSQKLVQAIPQFPKIS